MAHLGDIITRGLARLPKPLSGEDKRRSSHNLLKGINPRGATRPRAKSFAHPHELRGDNKRLAVLLSLNYIASNQPLELATLGRSEPLG